MRLELYCIINQLEPLSLQLALVLTSSPLMKGEIVSGSSGATGPRWFQFRVRPLLTESACSADVVRPYKTAIEFASCGQSVVVSLSRYMPSLGSQNTSLNRPFRFVAFVAQVEDSDVSFT